MAFDADAIARQVEGRSTFPVVPKDRRHATALATRPFVSRKDCVLLKIPRPTGRRRLRITLAVESKVVIAAVLGHNRDEDERPLRPQNSPSPLRDGQTKRRLRHVSSK